MVTKQLSDKELIQQMHNGNEKALSIIYKKYWELMYLAAFNLVKNHEVCEDIVQEIFINIWQKRERLEIKVSLKSYLYTSTIYKVYDYFRKNSSVFKVELLESYDNRLESFNPETKLIHDELIEHINLAIDQLPEKCGIVFRLSREDQLSYKEIAEKLNISHRTVEGHIAKAIKLLKTSIGYTVSIELLIFIFHGMVQ